MTRFKDHTVPLEERRRMEEEKDHRNETVATCIMLVPAALLFLTFLGMFLMAAVSQ
jgi:hypothetical protein